jgi:hypothetical protein
MRMARNLNFKLRVNAKSIEGFCPVYFGGMRI